MVEGLHFLDLPINMVLLFYVKLGQVMKTTVEVSDDLYRRAKSEAALRGRKLKDLVEEGLRLVLAAPPTMPSRPKLAGLMKDARGMVDPGTADLASNREPDADQLARALAQRTGENLAEAVMISLRERLDREERKQQTIESLVEDVMEIGRHSASLPLLDQRRPDEILGYDDNGLPR
jgi:antitoxin VapB